MTDVRSLLKNERASRRITHPNATYSTTGTLVCLVCHIQLKSESLWNGHLRSPQHAMRLQRIRDGALGRPPGAPSPEQLEDDEAGSGEAVTPPEINGSGAVQSKKRKADDDVKPSGKRNKSVPLPDDFPESVLKSPELPTNGSAAAEFHLPSRPATPMKPSSNVAPTKTAAVDEDEWAAFEAEIAAADAPEAEDAVISAPAMSAADIAAKAKEEERAQRKERMEAEMEGDKEDATRKLEEEFEEMGELEERVRKLKEKREALRLNVAGTREAAAVVKNPPSTAVGAYNAELSDEDDEEEEEDDDDDWDGFRLRK